MASYGSFLVYGNKRSRLYKIVVATMLCTLCYLVGLFQDFRGTLPAIVSKPSDCQQFQPIQTVQNITLDFASHHEIPDPPPSLGAELELPPCSEEFVEYTPCEDVTRSLRFERDRLIYRERHCPMEGEKMKCRVPAPAGYKQPFTWPTSRELVWYANVPHKELAVEKKNQNWVKMDGKDKFRFPGGGTMFSGGADKYIKDIGKFIDLKHGSIRTAIDTGCGVASWGAYLLPKNILTMSFAPRDTHEAQVQFALERGVPAMIGIIASIRLPYPSRAFDMAHCSRCLIPWSQYDGQYLLEVDRILRPGGFWILSGPPINWDHRWVGWNRTREDLRAEQDAIERLAKSMCWKKYAEEDDIAIWQKPLNHIHCQVTRRVLKKPDFCKPQDADKAWYTKLETCISPLPEVSGLKDVAGGKLANWPERLTTVPPRISGGTLEGITSETFYQDTELWKQRVAHYKGFDARLGEKGRYRNLLDMNAHLGGFAAALVGDPVWVMNIVPAEAQINTLGAIYERGLIGTYQNWCEAMSTYPRTYDFIHGNLILSMYEDRCDMVDVLLEMDRILRPEGRVILRDDVDVILKAKHIVEKMEWDAMVVDHETGPTNREKILFAVKKYWTLETANLSSSSNVTAS